MTEQTKHLYEFGPFRLELWKASRHKSQIAAGSPRFTWEWATCTPVAVCGFERSQPYGGITGYEYCPPDTDKVTRNRARLRQAQAYYQKAVSLLTEFEVESVAQYDDKENLLLGKQKIEAGAKYLAAVSF